MSADATTRAGALRWPAVVVIAPGLWLLCFVVLPLLVLLGMSLTRGALGDGLGIDASDAGVPAGMTLEHFRALIHDPRYGAALRHSLALALVTMIACLTLGLPLALTIARAPVIWRRPMLFAVLLPWITPSVLRAYGWIGLLSGTALSLSPAQAVLIGMIVNCLPVMVLASYVGLSCQDPRLLEAAADLGAPPWQRLTRITLPLALPGIMAGCMLVLMPALGEFVLPTILGGGDLTVGQVIWARVFSHGDWPLAASLGVVLSVLLVVPLILLQLQLRMGSIVRALT